MDFSCSEEWIETISVSQERLSRGLSRRNRPEGKKLFPSELPSLFQTSDPHAGYVSATTVTGWKSCRYAVPSLGPEAFGLQAAPFSKISESPARS
ncbi:hypothetical protein J1781_23565 [Rahnella sp. C60]|uniref:Uncharacterized protein n=1 Tax=Rahnella perminowiae TaxID=2816244 RepID=A0ABS6L0F9_9GAMM|nr:MULTISPECIES: hypothetical protein [Rahnella]MBU9817812.1 hypothetical protein [Rahnella perminowiae]MBU9825014.1 hypothetical protein [Rahnella perminowiae]MBU9835314.1 hypothetical protein [Rahnella perminowiae]UJD89633.1 hypothetical protein FS594_12935 [Rahnella aquatilis]